jgi:signal peptidase II
VTRRSNRAIAICVVVTLALLAADYAGKVWAQSALSEERIGRPPPVCEHPGQTQRRPIGHCADGAVCYVHACRDGSSCTVGIGLIPNFLEFQYAENCGAAFGLLDQTPDWFRRTVFGAAAFGAAIALFWMFVQGRGGRLFAYSVPLVVSGAVGNLIDRVRAGYVVDYIRFHVYDKFEWPTFNIADITIVIGVGLLVIDGMRKEQKEAEPQKAEAAPPRKKRSKKKAKKKRRAPEDSPPANPD